MALVSMTVSIASLPAESKTAIEIVSLWTSIPIYFLLSIKRVLLSGGFERNTQNLLLKGRPFILRRLLGMWPIPVSENPVYQMGAHSACVLPTQGWTCYV